MFADTNESGYVWTGSENHQHTLWLLFHATGSHLRWEQCTKRTMVPKQILEGPRSEQNTAEKKHLRPRAKDDRETLANPTPPLKGHNGYAAYQANVMISCVEC